jgi:hypothetical protein
MGRLNTSETSVCDASRQFAGRAVDVVRTATVPSSAGRLTLLMADVWQPGSPTLVT